MGGLGNQLFQIFTLISVSIKSKILYFSMDEFHRNSKSRSSWYYCDDILQNIKLFSKTILIVT